MKGGTLSRPAMVRGQIQNTQKTAKNDPYAQHLVSVIKYLTLTTL